jgi:hypothetical protein
MIHFVDLLQLKPPVCTFSKRPLFLLNLAIPSPAQKTILDSVSVLHKLEKSKETWSNHSTWQLISPWWWLVVVVVGGCGECVCVCVCDPFSSPVQPAVSHYTCISTYTFSHAIRSDRSN